MIEMTVIGDVNVDLLTSPIKTYPKKDLQTIMSWMRMEVGGGAAHFALAASKLGLKTRLIGLIGKDTFGNFIIEKLDCFNVENRLRKSNKEKTGISIGINFEDSSRSLLTFRGTNSIFSSKDFDIREVEGEALYVGGYNLLENFQKDVKEVLNYAKRRNMITCLEPDLKGGINCDVNELRNNLRLVDFFFPDLEEGRILTKEKNEKRIVKKILGFECKVVALKLGKKGCLIASKEGVVRIKGIKVEAINTTGAGDFFNSGFVFGYLKYKDLKKAGEFGNATAAFAITRFDDERYPTKEDVEKIVEREYGR